MCRPKPFPRCSHHARKKLSAAHASGDKNKIKAALKDWYLTPAGIAELQELGKTELAAKNLKKRHQLMLDAKLLQAQKEDRPIRVGIDLDNTVGDFTAGLRAHAVKRLGYTPEQALTAFPDPSDYSYVKSGWFESKESFMETFSDAEQSGIYKNLDAYPKAIETLREMAESGKVEIHFVTARNELWNEDTKHWLEKHKIPYTSLIHTDQKETTDMDVYLDDAGYQLQNLEQNGKKVIAFSQTYNEQLGDVPRVKDWSEVPAMIEKIHREVAAPKLGHLAPISGPDKGHGTQADRLA